jgi:hypothetical protein
MPVVVALFFLWILVFWTFEVINFQNDIGHLFSRTPSPTFAEDLLKNV